MVLASLFSAASAVPGLSAASAVSTSTSTLTSTSAVVSAASSASTGSPSAASLSVPLWVWAATIAGVLAVIALDLFVIGRRPHRVAIREAAWWLAATAALSLAFGAGLALFAGGDQAGRFLAGWITEYSLSVDNIFVFVVVMARFAVPQAYQHRALLIGVLVALVLRGAFIAAGAAVVSAFDWVFYLFGAFLVYTAAKLAAGQKSASKQQSAAQNEAEPKEAGQYENGQHDTGTPPAAQHPLVRFVSRFWPTTPDFRGTAMTARVGARRALTPMALVVLALGATDLLFALDSIPAVFGLTREPYLVFAANAFALLGLRQMYFLVGGLLDRLVYLSAGLSAVLGFIGVKMILEALHGSGVYALGPIPVPAIPVPLSLAVIVVVLAVTTVLSLTVGRRRLPAPAGHH